MSIKHFIDFIKTQKDSIKPIELYKTKVLIDGHQMQRALYVNSSKATKDYRYSTDYTTYAKTIKRFLRRLKICEITPIIIFDGCIDPERYAQAFRHRIFEIKEIKRNDYICGFQSPTLCNYVFSSVVRDFGVNIIQTCSQYATEMAELANRLKCPVISNKSIFFTLNIDFGLITEDMYSQRNGLHYSLRDKHWFLSSKVFRMDSLFKHYNGLRPQVIPLLDVILENNLIDQNGYKGLSDDINGWHENDRIDIMLNWLRGKSLDNALELIKKYLKSNAFPEDEQKSDLKIMRLMKKFELNGNNSSLLKYLMKSDYECESMKMMAKGDVEVVLPNWFINEYHRGIIRPALMNVIKFKTHVLYPQIEDFSLPSSYVCTLSLRQFLYGILRTEIENSPQIKVMDRKDLNKSEDFVSPLLQVSEFQELPYFGGIRKLDISQRRALFLSILGVTESFVNRIKVSLMLFDYCEEISSIDSTSFLIIIMRYWIQNNDHKDWKPFIGALILAIMYYSRQDLNADHKWTLLCKPSVEEKFEPKLIHYFSEFQACLHIANFINSILQFPIREGKPYYCLNGVFLYNATKRLSVSEKYEPFLNSLFREWSSLASVYNELIQLVISDLSVKNVNQF